MRPQARALPAVFSMILALAGCSHRDPSGGTPGTTPPTGDPNQDAGSSVDPHLASDSQTLLDGIQQSMAGVASLDAAHFAERYAVHFAPARSYDPSKAAHFAEIQASSLALSPTEVSALGARGFVITDAKRFPSFVYGYEAVYQADLPVFISADSVLEAVHRSYDKILANIELAGLVPNLREMLAHMSERLTAAPEGQTARDADVYLAVASSLLSGSPVQMVRGGDAALAGSLVEKAKAHAGTAEITLFGTQRTEDFSQFMPRGHYASNPVLSSYFQAMMWLGRVDMRILETQTDGTRVFRRRQLEAALFLRDLLDQKAVTDWTNIEDTVRAFVGEQDNMTLPDVDRFLSAVGATSSDVSAISDAKLAQGIVDGNFGEQRILSSIIVHEDGPGTFPLSASFALLGQRYVVDSHVFSNLVFDRVGHGAILRMMPSPLDVGFAALKNDQAGALLAPELARYPYAPDLAKMRVLVDATSADSWGKSLYNLWLASLRELSPATETATAAGLVAPFTGEAWGKRLLNTQLASWAELRHDTLLYAKQSYTSGNSCEFPAAYVDPYPAFFHRIGDLALRGKTFVHGLAFPPEAENAKMGIAQYFDKLGVAAAMLEAMADQERRGLPLTAEQLAFINEAVQIQPGCGSPAGFTGWYAQLYYDNLSAIDLDPTIADVHTQPTDEGGTEVGRILHVGTGEPRLMAVTVDGCDGPHAYLGLASSYFERVTEHYQRLDDQAWSAEITIATPADVEWMKDLVVR